MPDINMQVFEEAQRNQLVTEVDIQTQVALDDYQVLLSNIANPTQSQDNVVIDNGEFLPHWNESLDFDTWIKMSLEVAGKRILILHGNSSVSSTSSISNTFVFGDDFSGDLSKWTLTQSTSGNVQIVSNELRIVGNSNWNANGAASNDNTSLPVIIEFDKKASASNQYNYYGYSVHPLNYNSGVLMQDADSANLKKWIDGASAIIGTYSIIWEHMKIILDSSNYYLYQDSSLLSSGAYTTDNYKIVFQQYNTNYFYINNVRSRKYTADEPSWLADGTEQNIATALKSLGRAG